MTKEQLEILTKVLMHELAHAFHDRVLAATTQTEPDPTVTYVTPAEFDAACEAAAAFAASPRGLRAARARAASRAAYIAATDSRHPQRLKSQTNNAVLNA